MRKNKKIELPSLVGLDMFVDEDLINLGEKILELLRNQIGCDELYVVYKNWNDKFDYEKCNIKDICFSQESYGGCVNLKFNNVYGSIWYIFKKQEDAEKYCNIQNVSFLEKQIENIKQSIDDLNPVKIMEDAEKKRQELIEKYQALKNQLEETKKIIEEKTDESVCN